jgi:DNA processing protein
MNRMFKKIKVEDLLGRKLNEVEKNSEPPYLFITGKIEIPILKGKISVVGTRNPSQEGTNIAREISRQIVKNDVIVVSGLANGIDTVAHVTAIENKGNTIAVLGTPLERFYPKENEELQEEIMKSHLAISQFPPGSHVEKSNFIRRNRLMALVSDATIIVEAGIRSGTISQGWETLRLGRPLYIWTTLFDKVYWAKEMEKYGAMRLGWENFADIFDEVKPVLNIVINEALL